MRAIVCVLILPLALGARRVHSQAVNRPAAVPPPGAAPADDAPQCLGFAFAKWAPALDWQHAGHGATPDSALVPRAPGGRGWAADALGHEGDSTVVLYPVWWPAGVVIHFDRKPAVPGDTVVGRATALVADAESKAPQTTVRAWSKGCGTP